MDLDQSKPFQCDAILASGSRGLGHTAGPPGTLAHAITSRTSRLPMRVEVRVEHGSSCGRRS
eukprot:2774311-Rhodomonas_salina.1